MDRGTSGFGRKKATRPSKQMKSLEDTPLRGKTEFIGNVQFWNDTPDLPFDPKLTDHKTDLSKFVRRKQTSKAVLATSVERSYKHEIHSGQSLSIPLNLIDPSAFDRGGDLHPDDQAIINAAKNPVDKTVTQSPAAAAVPKFGAVSPRQTNFVVPWLRRTEYVSTHSKEKAPRMMLKAITRDKSRGEVGDVRPVCDIIEESFEKAKIPPRHPRNPALQPVKIRPILPAFKSITDEYVHVICPENPMSIVRKRPGYELRDGSTRVRNPENAKSAALCHDPLLFAMVNDNDESEPPFLAYVIPKPKRQKISDDDEDGVAIGAETNEAEYDYAQSYDYGNRVSYVMNDETNEALYNNPGQSAAYVLVMDEEEVAYHSLQTKLSVSRKVPNKSQTPDQRFKKPSHITLSYCPRPEQQIEHRFMMREKILGKKAVAQIGDDEDSTFSQSALSNLSSVEPTAIPTNEVQNDSPPAITVQETIGTDHQNEVDTLMQETKSPDVSTLE